MLVNSIPFFIFFIIIIIPYFLLGKLGYEKQNVWLLFASYFFYGWADWRMVPLLIIVTIVFYLLGLSIAKDEIPKKITRLLLTCGIVFGVGLLLYFKYLNFFIEQFAALLGLFGLKTNYSSFNLIVPIGLSFFTFKLISYIIEVSKGAIKPTRNFVTFATYIAFFPTIMSGPIDRPNMFIPQLEQKRTADWDNVLEGCKRILWGMFLKMCIADKISPYTDAVFNNYYHHSGLTIVVAAALYSFQIYADFCGYSEMAIGVGRIMGIKVTENFNRPFFAQNIAEYWRRWHITLTTWLTDYVFTPLSVSFRNWGMWGINLAVMINMAAIGLWHGANWTFLVFGLMHGLMLVSVNLTQKRKKKFEKKHNLKNNKLWINSRRLWTFTLVSIGLIMFRAYNVGNFFNIIERFTASGGLFFSWALTAIIPICIMMFKELKDEEQWNLHFLHSKNVYVEAISFALLAVFVFYSGELEGAKFIYFQF